MKRFSLWFGISLIGLAFLSGMAGPILVNEDPFYQDLDNALNPPGHEYPLGTDHLGRSVLSRLVFGTRRSLVLSALCVGLSVSIGTAAGLIAGFSKGWMDIVIMRFVDGLLAFPGILLAIVLAGTLGSGTESLVAALVLTMWCDYCRLIRNITYSILSTPYMEAGMLLGFSSLFLTRRYIIGQLIPQLFTLASLGMGRTILNVSSLGFLGIGLKPPTPEWGAMISQGIPYLTEAPYLVVFPGAAILMTVLGFQLLAVFANKGSE
ncbi:MAG: ABC transporter permease [Deltaproteobacteria bacterium]|nr:ABC transporter permease [Deltaproteobacteria bacterium]